MKTVPEITVCDNLQKMCDEVISHGIMPRWFSLSTACFYAGLGEKTLLRLIMSGDIYGTRPGGKWIIDRLSIDEYFLRDEKQVKKVLAQISQKR